MSATDSLTQFVWHPQPEVATFIAGLVSDCLKDCPFAARLAERMRVETGNRLADWVDHFVLPSTNDTVLELAKLGYSETAPGEWRISTGLFPPVKLSGPLSRLFLKVESVADFVLAHNLSGKTILSGSTTASIRTAHIAEGSKWQLQVIERHGDPSLNLSSPREIIAARLLKYTEAFNLRPRDFEDLSLGFLTARRLITAAAAELGMSRACELFFAAERRYWQSRNHVARIQKMRQDALGLGWANHDHHTYRSSRKHFAELIALFELMGFRCRERFYAGREAGWGAQVLEDPATGVVIFADVDLSPEEVTEDFSHTPLKERDSLGTVGLWCALHGEAFLQAGMHHLECQFDFNATKEGLKETGVDTMKPFTDFPYLRQAFTKGEVWSVEERRIKPLLDRQLITPEQAELFRTRGAVGSHLEILQRDDGYKGFNQTGINEIIRATDPRRLSEGLSQNH